MQENYSQLRGMLAITRASLRATFRSPSAVVFSIGFPLIFILVFGFLGGGGNVSFKIAFAEGSDTSNGIYKALRNFPAVKVVEKTPEEEKEDLEKGRLLAILDIRKNADTTGADYQIGLKSSEAVNMQNLTFFKDVFLSGVISQINNAKYGHIKSVAQINPQIEKIPGRVYRTIDFILPGQLGFSLLSAGIFGVAFLFFNLRQQLVLKRFFATPIRRSYIVLGEALSRVIFQMITAVIIIGVGTLAFHFTLVKGFETFIEIMLLSFLALIVFMGFGFVVSGVAKNESTIPPFANLFTLPQFLLAGTFFSIDAFPSWLQPICKILPLTHFNNAMRNIAFEGASLLSCWREIGILAIWGVVIYAIAIKVFKWE
ncbi:MAG: ABC transporter permease [Filimonas sp.]|nr:ABC transporter permease [Filimonas sp.]